MDDLTLGQMIFGGVSTSKTPGNTGSRPVNNTTTTQGIAVSNSMNGVVDVLIDNQRVTVSTTFAVATGDVCIISVTNGNPVVTGIAGKGDKVDNVIDGTIRATTAIISSLIVGSVDAEKIEAAEAYIKNLTADNFTAENINATTATFTELLATDAKFDNLTATKAVIDTLEATKAFIEDLEAKKVTTDQLVASAALVDSLKANNITAEDISSTHIYVNALEGAYADVDELVADLANVKKLSVEELDARYAKIDLTNIKEACIKTAYIEDAAITEAKIQNGSIHDAHIADATITAGKIHDLDADLITAGTLKTERLLLVDNETGQTSIIKAINVANGVATDVASGTKIQAESIDVVDLWALNATIGGFTIDRRSIYNAKKAIDDPDSGVFVGLDGVGIGDGHVLGLTDKSPFMVKSDGTFWLGGNTDNLEFDPFTGKLNINVSELSIDSKNIVKVLDDIDGRVTTNSTQITQNANQVMIQFGTIQEDLDKTNSDVNEIRSFIRFGSNSEYGSYMELGKNDDENSKFQTLVTNLKGLLFLENGQMVAWINNESMHITKGEIEDTLAIRNWKFEQRSNGNLSFKWREWENA